MIRVYAHPDHPRYFTTEFDHFDRLAAAIADSSDAAPGGEWADFDATMATTGPDGSLTLVRIDVRVVTNPENLQEKRLEHSNPQLVRIIAAGLWGDVENLDLEETT